MSSGEAGLGSPCRDDCSYGFGAWSIGELDFIAVSVMDVELHCQGCGKLIRAPREAAGRWAQCPACGRQLYIPTPSAELEELALAPEDTAFLAQEAALQAERRRIDRVLNREGGGAGEAEVRRPASRERPVDAVDLESAVLNYLKALSRSDLAGAEQLLPVLRRHQSDVLKLLDRLAADQMPPLAMGSIPAGVFQGFLKHLRGQLSV